MTASNESGSREAYSAKNSIDAHLMKNVLEAEGIAVQVVGDALQNAIGDLPVFAVEPKLWVRSTDFDQARRIVVAEEKRQHDLSGVLWECPTCGEFNEPSFDSCWQCQTDRSPIA